MTSEEVLYFNSPQAFRTWLHEQHDQLDFQWIGYYKKASKIPSMTWSESVDQALCYGWIDGLRKRVDDKRYKIRFTPRKVKSHWSKVNLDKMKVLIAEKQMMPAGLAIFNKRDIKNAEQFAYEQKEVALSETYLAELQKNAAAWGFYENNLAPSYKKQSIHWVMAAKQEATRDRRFKILLESCEQGLKIPQMRKWKK